MQKECGQFWDLPIEQLGKLTGPDRVKQLQYATGQARRLFQDMEAQYKNGGLGAVSLGVILGMFKSHVAMKDEKDIKPVTAETMQENIKKASDNFPVILAVMVDWLRKEGLTKWDYKAPGALAGFAKLAAEKQIKIDPLATIFEKNGIVSDRQSVVRKELGDFADFIQRTVTLGMPPQTLIGHLLINSIYPPEGTKFPKLNSPKARSMLIGATTDAFHPNGALDLLQAAFCKGMGPDR